MSVMAHHVLDSGGDLDTKARMSKCLILVRRIHGRDIHR